MIRRRDMLLLGVMGLGGVGLMGRLLIGAKPKPLCEDPLECQERQTQQDLPHADDPIWAILKKCQVSLDRQAGTYQLVPTPEVQALAGKQVQVKGFVVPLDGTDRTKDFLIGVNTPVCFYHPPGDPNELMEVNAVSPISWTDKPTTIVGTFTLVQNNQIGVFFKLVDARSA